MDVLDTARRVQTLDQLSEILRQLRRRQARQAKSAPLSVRELADRSGYSRAAIAEYLNGRTLPPTDRFDVLVGLLDASPQERGALATARDRVEEHRRAHRNDYPAPRQLPLDVPAFTGREPELAQLGLWAQQAQAGEGTETVSMISGPAGVGKTALIVHWAHRVTADYPNGQLYLDLRGYAAEEPLTSLQALTRFLTALGMSARRVPPNVDEAATAYRSRLADRRMLIVLDNAAHAEQVRPLLPGGRSCHVLVASRDRLAGLIAREGARCLPLGLLDPDDARTLLVRLLGAGRVDAEAMASAELTVRCGGLPLALRIAAASLAVRPGLAIASYVQQLQGADQLAALTISGDEQASVAAAFDLSYNRLPGPARRMFRLLGLVPGPDISVDAAAALAGTPTALARSELMVLADAHLIQECAPGRYSWHDLLRIYARERVEREEPSPAAVAARDRLYGYYYHAADAATSLIYPPAIKLPTSISDGMGTKPAFRDPTTAAHWLDRELPNLVAAVQQAATSDNPAMCWLLSNGMRGYLQRTAPSADSATILDTALHAARSAGDRRAEGSVRLGRATLRFRLGAMADGLTDSADALAACRDAGWIVGQAGALGNLGLGHVLLGQLSEGVEYLMKTATMMEQVGSLPQLAVALGGIPDLLLELGRRTEAIHLAERAIAVSMESGSDFPQAWTLGRIGTACWRMGEPEAARECLVRALANYRKCGDGQGECVALSTLATVHFDLGRQAFARQLATMALRLARRMDDRKQEINALLALAGAEEPPAARRSAELALSLAQAADAQYEQCRAWLAVAAAVLADVAPLAEARAAVDQALIIARSLGYRILEGQALTTSAQAWLAAGDTAAAVADATQALMVHRETGHRQGEDRALALLCAWGY